MAEKAVLPVLKTAGRAYRDAWRALFAFPVSVGICLVLVCCVMAMRSSFEVAAVSPSLGFRSALFAWIVNATFAMTVVFLETPLAISIHRLILLNDVSSRYFIQFGEFRFYHYYSYFVFIFFLFFFLFLFSHIPHEIYGVKISTSISLGAIFLLPETSAFLPLSAIDIERWNFFRYVRLKGYSLRAIVVYFIVIFPVFFLYKEFTSISAFEFLTNIELIDLVLLASLTLVIFALVASASTHICLAIGYEGIPHRLPSAPTGDPADGTGGPPPRLSASPELPPPAQPR